MTAGAPDSSMSAGIIKSFGAYTGAFVDTSLDTWVFQ